MTKTKFVRASRGGDQFHYLWAARRCLLLLPPHSELVAISIEGASPMEVPAESKVEAGEEVIDVAEYYGSEDIEHATLVRYIQLKHSTLRVDAPWTLSGLEKTLKGFAQRYKELQQRYGGETLVGKIEFCVVSNRPIHPGLHKAIDDAAEGTPSRSQQDYKKLKLITGLDSKALSAFCKLLSLEGKQEDYWHQRNSLIQDVSGYLPGADVDAPIQLKELVTRKALPESSTNPTITKHDVLRVLGTDEDHLFPAPRLLKEIEKVVPREQEAELIDSIVQAADNPVILHAGPGVGKSVISTRIKLGLPEGSFAVLYDCFGNGQYRSASGYRHRHKDALVQMANELAGEGLCYPLIPATNADPADYIRAFLSRLGQSITSLRGKNASALLCVIIDAADNAQIAANEIGEKRSFVIDLLREKMPEGVRLVALCRTHRLQTLNPPHNALRLELQPFSRAETAKHLRYTFPDASKQDIDEFHRMSSRNPRVQAMALSVESPLNEILRRLGPNPKTVEDAIENLFDEAVAKLLDSVSDIERTQIERVFAGLATLRPFIPISVLSSMSGVEEAAIRSFALDLGRPLIVTEDSIQFFDESAETWFRECYKPKQQELHEFVESLKPLAADSAYVSSVLPQLMLEAGQFAELITLALSSEGLPEKSPLERRDVELQRLQFAIKASLRQREYSDAVKLALKAGGESAGDERQRKLLQANTDLAARFMDSDRIQEAISRKSFGTSWLGSRHAYEAGLLSGRKELSADARSRLRTAHEWLKNWSRLSEEQRKPEQITFDDIAEIAIAHLNIHGPESCTRNLRSWRPREVSFRAGRILARRLVDHGRYQNLDDLAVAGANDLRLILAITLELRRVHKNPPKDVVERTLRHILNPRIKIRITDNWSEETVLQAVTALVEAAYRLSVGDTRELTSLLMRYLPTSPPRGISNRYNTSRFTLLHAYTLQAALTGRSLEIIDVAHPELRKALDKENSPYSSHEAREFEKVIGALLPWHQLWAETFLGRINTNSISAAIENAKSASSKATIHSYQEELYTSNEIALLWLDILYEAGATDAASMDYFTQWINSLKWPLHTTTLAELARFASRTDSLKPQSLEFARRAYEITRDTREDADCKSSSYVNLARAVLTVSESEAEAYFNEAIEVASRIGDENLSRWDAILRLAERAAKTDRANPEIAYKLSRCAELTYDYVARDKYFEWEATVRAIAGLCPSSTFAILSRWRDRDFGSAERLLPTAVEFLLERGKIDPKTALALVGFRAHWDEVSLLHSALDACLTKDEKENVSAFLYRYMVLQERDAQTWRDLKDLAMAHGLVLPDIDELISYNEHKERSKRAENESKRVHSLSETGSEREGDWDAIFEEIDLTSANGISTAYKRFMDCDPPYDHDRFFKEACGRVSPGTEAEFIIAIAEVPKFILFNFRSFLEQIPESWRSRLAFKRALASTLKAFCQRNCMAITRSRYYEVLPFKTVCELSGMPESEIVEVVLRAIGETTEPFSADRLFSLVGLLAVKLSEKESLEALNYGLDLFDDTLEDTDGDGPWSEAIAPPTVIDSAVSGYVWAALASPKSNVRWEAAHVVRGLCTLGREEVLGHLIALARGNSGEPFVDTRLHFYNLHARQWLLIALARAAKDTPSILIPHADFLLQAALKGEPHVLIREFAARAALILLDNGLSQVKPDLRQRLESVNKSRIRPIASPKYDRFREQKEESSGSVKDVPFSFSPDIGPYWYAPLGRCFAKSQNEIEYEAWRVMTVDWQYSGTFRGDEDERTRRRIFKDQETYHSHSSYPSTDNLQFYLAYHAMMVVAGKLLETVPLHYDHNDPDFDFNSWLSDHGLSRDDGFWLADRRDPSPLEWPSWKDERETDDWRWSISRSDFDRVLLLAGRWMNLWGRWTDKKGSREESVEISSALVTPSRSEALLRALQTASHLHEYRIPDADNGQEIDHEGFKLKGWVDDWHLEKGLDFKDPWAGEISYPPISPSQFVRDLMNLSSDFEQRIWCANNGQQEWGALRSHVWGQFSEKGNNTEGGSGRRIQASSRFVFEFLRKIGMDLIVSVEIDRRLIGFSYRKYGDEDNEYYPPSARLFLIRTDGNIYAI